MSYLHDIYSENPSAKVRYIPGEDKVFTISAALRLFTLQESLGPNWEVAIEMMPPILTIMSEETSIEEFVDHTNAIETELDQYKASHAALVKALEALTSTCADVVIILPSMAVKRLRTPLQEAVSALSTAKKLTGENL